MEILQQQIIFCFFFITQAQGCSLQTGNGNGLPDFGNTEGRDVDNVGGVLGRRRQAIISSYKFDCTGQNLMCGNITEWGADLWPGGGGHDMEYTIDFQVWRPSPTVDDSTGTGCYSLVGNNRFTSIPLSDGLARVTPSPQDYIMFRPGDVLGFYVEETENDEDDGVVVLTRPSRFTSELVWYASIAPTMATSQNGDCPYSVGSNGVLNTLIRAAPVISISTTTFSCPPLPSMATTQPTPQPPNPTTDSEETPPTTNQQTQEAADCLTTNGNTNDDIQVTDSEGSSIYADTDLSILSSQSESTNIGLIIGIVVIIVIVTVTVVIIIAILLKKYHVKFTSTAVPTAANQAYGLNTHKGVAQESIYKFPDPEVDADNTIEAKLNVAYVTNTDVIVEVNEAYATIEGNEAYATNIIAVGNEVYATCIVTEGNQAYSSSTNISTEGNQAYATSITTEKNAAYEPVSTSETADVYEVVRL